VTLPGAEVSFQELYNAFSSFSRNELGWKEPVSQNSFSRKMKSKNLTRVPKGGRAYFSGVGLKTEI
jgi:hypothetical protein